jgi:hypothetical protein
MIVFEYRMPPSASCSPERFRFKRCFRSKRKAALVRKSGNAPDHEAVSLVFVNSEIPGVGLAAAFRLFRRVCLSARSLRCRAKADCSGKNQQNQENCCLHHLRILVKIPPTGGVRPSVTD